MLKFYNTLTREKEFFKPFKKNSVGLYTCGPTVYNFAHIGNLRAYIFEDILKRVLVYNGYKVKHVMNITDVGHLTGDQDMGEDKLEKGAKRENKTVWEIVKFFTEAFKNDLKLLNIIEPNIWCKATDYIKEQIDLIKILEKKGYTYKTSDGIYYNTSKFKNYNKLSGLDLETLREGARVEKNVEKKNPTDFALWKFSPKDSKRQMEWDSPWGVGFPGWHIECSAMSLKLLGNQLDIHCGGIDHINIHHTNEIAQSEVATGKKFFNYWMHGAFLNIAGGKKMAKSEDNFLTLKNVFTKQNIKPLVYRFFLLQAHYRKPVEYSQDGIKNAQNGLEHLYNQVKNLGKKIGIINNDFKKNFLDAINNDLNMPQALGIVQKLLKSNLANQDKLKTILDFDKVLGLRIKENTKNIIKEEIPHQLQQLLDLRKIVKDDSNFIESDRLRNEIKKLGYSIEDTKDGQKIKKII